MKKIILIFAFIPIIIFSQSDGKNKKGINKNKADLKAAAQEVKREADRKMKALDEDQSTPKNVTNAMFVGSTSDLQKMLKQMGSNK